MNTIRINVKHGTKVRMVLRAGERVIDAVETPIELMEGQKVVWGITFNALSVSGGVRWVHPVTGEHFSGPPKVSWDFIDPTDQLAEGEFCDCVNCEELKAKEAAK
jgi:hypothetical protein